jgi:putative membrane protein
MIEKARNYPLATVLILGFYYLVGIAGLLIEKTQSLFQALVPATLLFTLYFLWLFHEKPARHFYLAAVLVYLLGFIIELIGVNTGAIFGEYVYGETLGTQLWNTPLMIGVNWLILIYSCWALTGLFTENRLLRYLAGSLLMVIYDLALEPVAVRLDMWTWHWEGIPLQNYTGWFLTSMILFILFDRIAGEFRNKIAPAVFIIQFVFFVSLNLLFRYH